MDPWQPPPQPPIDAATLNTYLNATVPPTTPPSTPQTIETFLQQHCPLITGTDLTRIRDCLAFANFDVNTIKDVRALPVKGEQWWRLVTTDAWQRGVTGRPAPGDWDPWPLGGFHATTNVGAIGIIKSRMLKKWAFQACTAACPKTPATWGN